MKAGEVKLTKRGFERWKKGHPWIYESDVEAPKSLAGGEVVRVVDFKGWLLGQAFFQYRNCLLIAAAFFIQPFNHAGGLINIHTTNPRPILILV